MDAEAKKLENEIKEALLNNKPRMIRQGAYDHTKELEDHRRELVRLLSWLGLYITKCSN